MQRGSVHSFLPPFCFATETRIHSAMVHNYLQFRTSSLGMSRFLFQTRRPPSPHSLPPDGRYNFIYQ